MGFGRFAPLGWAALVLAGAVPPAAANDSSAELSIGGLVFTRNADVSMESEDLTITPETVTVRYVFLNNSAKPVTLTVAFPLPDLDLSEPDVNYALPTSNPDNFVGFQTKVDGQPVKFDVKQRAMLGDKDVSETVRAAGLALLPIGGQEDKIAALGEAERNRLIDKGLLIPSGSDQNGRQIYSGAWTVKTSFVRTQTFPPAKPVTVEHRYRTSVGMSLDTVLRKALRESQGMTEEIQRYRTEYCFGDDFLKSLDKIAGAGEANTSKLQERRIKYVLKTGANWAGPIKSFHLVVDKGRPTRLLSLCIDNIKKTSPTAFEFRATDFTPDKDLNILLVGRD